MEAGVDGWVTLTLIPPVTYAWNALYAYRYLTSFWEASMLGHDVGIGYMGPGPRMGPTDNFSLVTGPGLGWAQGKTYYI